MKKITIFVLAIIILFSFNKALADAPSISLSASMSEAATQEYVTITANVKGMTKENVRFYSWPKVEGFDSVANCDVDVKKNSCSVKFQSSSAGTYEINASVYVHGYNKDYKTDPSKPLKITISSAKLTAAADTEVYPGDPLQISVSTSNKKNNVTVNFPSLVGKICVTSIEGMCSITYIWATEGTAKVTYSAEGYEGGEISVNVTKTAPRKTEPLIPDLSGKPTDTTYTPLAELPGLEGPIQTDEACAFGKYMNIIFRLVIGISAVLAMVMIVYGGIEYMTGGAISEKENGKDTITNAILGLVIALGAWLLLNTLNPTLLNMCLDMSDVQIVIGPDAGDDTVDPDFSRKKYTYSTDATVSAGVTSALAKIRDGWNIEKFTVHTNNKMTIELKKGTQYDYSSIIDIAPGLNGYAKNGTASTGDKKTPIGNWKIIDIRYKPGIPQFNSKGSNMGAAFWHLSPMTSGERGIGMHGNKRGTLGSTNGCIRLKNADILALQPYIKTGIEVSVKE